jgi:hypothetical protein
MTPEERARSNLISSFSSPVGSFRTAQKLFDPEILSSCRVILVSVQTNIVRVKLNAAGSRINGSMGTVPDE